MFRTFLLLFTILQLTGCVYVPKYIALDPKINEKVSDIEVFASIPQDEVIVVAQDPGVAAAAGGGLLMALIDSHISKGRQEQIQHTIAPLYAAIDDVDFRNIFWNTVLPGIKNSPFGKLAEVRPTPRVVSHRERTERLAKLAQGRGFLHVMTTYSLTQDFKQLAIVTTIDFWIGGQELPAYSNIFRYESNPTTSNPINAWAQDSGKPYRMAIEEGAKEIAMMLDLDLKYPVTEGIDKNLPSTQKPVSISRSPGTFPSTITGTLLAEKAGRIVIRHSDGRLYSLPHSPEKGSAK
ncbi:MAG: hypothetical protein K2X06_14405 [Burkholderiales bacterium]|nr:hypothetical protein [Burkholderiales bacterium]